jgi:hypothetical protein
MSAARRFHPAEHVHFRAFDDAIILLDLSEGEYFSLDAVGAFAWERLTRGETLGEIAAAEAAEFSVDEATALRDLEAFTSELEARRLVTRVEDAP